MEKVEECCLVSVFSNVLLLSLNQHFRPRSFTDKENANKIQPKLRQVSSGLNTTSLSSLVPEPHQECLKKVQDLISPQACCLQQGTRSTTTTSKRLLPRILQTHFCTCPSPVLTRHSKCHVSFHITGEKFSHVIYPDMGHIIML